MAAFVSMRICGRGRGRGGGTTQAETGARFGSPARAQLFFRPQRSGVFLGGGGGSLELSLLEFGFSGFCRLEGRFLSHESWRVLANGSSLSPSPPPATTNPLRSVHCCSRYLFKGLITLRFMWGGGRKRGGVQVPRLVSLPFVLQCLYG